MAEIIKVVKPRKKHRVYFTVGFAEEEAEKIFDYAFARGMPAITVIREIVLKAIC